METTLDYSTREVNEQLMVIKARVSTKGSYGKVTAI